MASDKFANIATVEVTMSGANVLSFAELRTQVGINPDRKSAAALIIDEIDYLPGTASIGEMTTAADEILMAITISNAVTDIKDITDRRILHAGDLLRKDNGTAASAELVKLPLVHQFFPPLITAERSLYLGMDSVGLASAGILRCRIYHRVVQITQGEFLELAEVFRLVG